MTCTLRALLLVPFALLALGPVQTTNAQGVEHRVSHVIVPPIRGFSVRPNTPAIEIVGMHAQVTITDRTANTVLDIRVHNPGTAIAEAVILQPLPRGAVVGSFAFEGPGAEPTARLLPRDEARRIYDSIVRQVRDPAILEFAGYDLVRSSVFPVEAGGTQRLRLAWEEVLGGDSNRIDYVLPRSDSQESNIPFTAKFNIVSQVPIASIYSPSHELEITRPTNQTAAVATKASGANDPGTFRMSILQDSEQIPASIFAYPDPTIGGGYFLLVAGAPPRSADEDGVLPREVTIVLDRSGSMAGEKMDQARAAALQIVESLGADDAFNIIDYGTTVSSFFDAPLPVGKDSSHDARRYLSELRPNGGTNIHDALLDALRAERAPGGAVGIVLFLTDGIPTVGRTSERQIRELVESGNVNERRIFTFGVGTDVNAPLLDRIADVSRGYTTYVLPGDDVEVAVADVAKRLGGPVLTSIEVSGTRNGGAGNTGPAIHDVLPAITPDLYSGDQLVLLGTYRGEDPLTFEIQGKRGDEIVTQTIAFDVSEATTRNAFVPRLWASRQIAYLVDEIRQAGDELTLSSDPSGRPILSDPRYQELIDEIVRLSTRFGVLTEYTSFLAETGTNLGEWGSLLASCGTVLQERSIEARSGASAVNQGINFNNQKQQSVLNPRNWYVDADLKKVEIRSVQQIADCALFRQSSNWIDSRLIVPDTNLEPDETIEYGSDRHLELVHQLAEEGRQGLLSLDGMILLEHEGRVILVNNN